MVEMNAAIFFIFHILFFNKAVAENEKAGPYKAVMLNAKRCDKPSRPYQKDPPMVFFAEVYNTTKKYNLMRGNITILREKIDYRVKSRCYVQEDGRWKISVVLNSGGCRGVLLTVFTAVMGLPYDKEKCILKKGTFNFTNVDSDQMEHAWTSTKIYGATMCRIEVSTGTQTAECWEFYEMITPK